MLRRLIVVLMVAQAADLLTFLAMTSAHGITAELNPVVVWIATDYGLAWLTAFKIGATALAVTAAVAASRDTPSVALGLVVFGITTGFVGAYSNILSL